MVLSDLAVDACGRAGALRETFVRSVQRNRAAPGALPSPAGAGSGKVSNAGDLSAAKLFTIGKGGGALDAPIPADC
ncbi:MAG TPA: hypothetical protein VHM91_04770 [Verrucomicrobiales bacterium]|nr:hypothetical protein [Verrucomicrobiales bacterium]